MTAASASLYADITSEMKLFLAFLSIYIFLELIRTYEI